MDIEYVKTSDLDLASTLLSLGFPIDGIYFREHSDFCDFYFKQSPTLDQTIKNYWARQLHVEPIMLFASRKEILTRMREEQRREENIEEYN